MNIMDHLDSPHPQIRSRWTPEATGCLLVSGNAQSAKANLISTLITDTALLVIMLTGLLRLGFHERGAFGVGRLLWKQVSVSVLLSCRGVLTHAYRSQGYYLALDIHPR